MLQTIVLLALKLSIVLTVLAVALKVEPREATYLLRHPAKLVRSLIALNVVMPLLVLAMVVIFPLQPVVKVVLVALSVSPVPPFLPNRVLKMGGSEPYIIGLLAIAALLSIILIPIIISIFGMIFGVEAHTDPLKIAVPVTVSVLAPLAAGIVIRNFWPRLADRAASPVASIAAILLGVTGLIGIIGAWPLVVSLIGNGAILAFLAFVVVGVTVGHILGGPAPEDRTVLAFATASRHPGVAIAVATANFPDPKLAAAAVFLFLLVSIVGTVPYTMLRKHYGNPPAPHLPMAAR